MPRLLASYPPSWILAMGTSADAGQAEPGEPLSPDTAVAVGRAGDGHHGRGSGRYPDV
jgi:hypothetical protein